MSWFAKGLFWNVLANPSSKMLEPMEPCFPIFFGEEAKHLPTAKNIKNMQQVWETILNCKFGGPLLSNEIVHTSQQIMIDFNPIIWYESLGSFFGSFKAPTSPVPVQNGTTKDDTRNMLDVCYVDVNSPPVTSGQKVSRTLLLMEVSIVGASSGGIIEYPKLGMSSQFVVFFSNLFPTKGRSPSRSFSNLFSLKNVATTSEN